MSTLPYTYDRPSVQNVVRLIIAGDIDKVTRWNYYSSRRIIDSELARLGLLSWEIQQKLFALEDSAKESL